MLDLQMGAARFKLIIMYFKNQAGRLGRCLKYCREADVEFLKHYFDDTPLSEIDILELEHVFLYTPRYLMVVMTLGIYFLVGGIRRIFVKKNLKNFKCCLLRWNYKCSSTCEHSEKAEF